MRELRTCPVTGRVVLLNDGWPDAVPDAAPRPPEACWLCGDPGPVIWHRDGARAVPHPEPVLGIEGDVTMREEDGRLSRDAIGAHEILFGAHDGPDAPLLALGFDRIADLRKDRRLRGFRLVRRVLHGHHVAWQLFALPFELPPSAPAAWRDGERKKDERVIATADGAVAIAAWAPREPFECWVLPADGAEAFGSRIEAVAALSQRVAERIGVALGQPPVDLIVEEGAPWRVEILPQIGQPRAFSTATAIPLHGVFPEMAARYLRERMAHDTRSRAV